MKEVMVPCEPLCYQPSSASRTMNGNTEQHKPGERVAKVIARAGNRTLADRDPTAHAEIIAIRAAAASLGSERLDACDLYVTIEPCAMCAGAVAFARIRRLYYGAADPKGGAVDNGVKFFASPSCHHRPEVYGGLAEAEAGALLKEFFRERR